MDAQQRLVIKAEAEGMVETARGVETVAIAQQRLLEVNKQLEQARLTGTLDEVRTLTTYQDAYKKIIADMTGEQKEATQANVNFGEALRKIHPLLGDAMAALSRYAGAAGIAGAAIAVLTAAARAMGESFAKAANEVKSATDALNQIKGEERGSAQRIENIRAGSKLGPFQSVEAASAAQATARDVREKYSFIGADAVETAVAMTAGGDFTTEETARIARLYELPNEKQRLPGPGTRASRVPTLLRRALDRNRDSLDATFALENQQREVARQRAEQQLYSESGSTLELREQIEKFAPPGADLDSLVDLARFVKTGRGLEEIDRRLSISDAAFGAPQKIAQAVDALVPGPSVSPAIHASRRDVAILRGFFAERESRLRQKQTPSQAPNEYPPSTTPSGVPSQLYPMEPHSSARPVDPLTPPATPTTTINHYNSRFIGSDAAAQRKRMTNGETKARAAELV